jgi:hypothetical protein
MSYKDRSALKANGKISPVMYNRMLIINGVIEGSWQRTITKDKLTVEIAPFTALTNDKLKLVKKAIENYSQFVGKTIQD